MPKYDVIVVGLGGHGSSIAYHAAKHRLLRLGYAEGRAYVPMLLRAVELWRDLERRTGERLFIRSGVLSGSPGGRGSVEDARTCSEAFGISHQMLEAREINQRFPAFNMAPGMAGLLQHDAGFVMSEATIANHVLLAATHGADLRARTPVVGIEQKSNHVIVTTQEDKFEAGQVVVAAGTWIGKLVPDLSHLHTVARRALGFFQPQRPADFAADVCPGYTFSNDDLSIYGFPIFGFPGVKIGRDGHLNETGDPDELSRDVGPRDEACLREGVRAFLRDCDGPLMRLQACVLNDTPDKNFVIDRLPDMPSVHIASMCSGHGFKFSTVTGEILADRLQNKPDKFDLSPFRLARFV
jgi:sarcosine oxidase